MAKKNVNVNTKPERTKEEVLDKIRDLVADFNDNAEFAMFSAMKKLDEEISVELAAYTDIVEGECFDKLKQGENPLFEAAQTLRFATVAVRDEKQDGGGTRRVVQTEDVTKPIDPMKLHNAVKGGIGANKDWPHLVTRLNYELTVRRAIELGIDPQTVRDCYAIKDEAKALEGFLVDDGGKKKELNYNEANKRLLANMQRVVDAMIGEGYEVKKTHAAYLLSIFTKKDNARSLSVTAAKDQYMRQYMLEVCHAAINGTEITLNFKKKK